MAKKQHFPGELRDNVLKFAFSESDPAGSCAHQQLNNNNFGAAVLTGHAYQLTIHFSLKGEVGLSTQLDHFGLGSLIYRGKKTAVTSPSLLCVTADY